MERELYIKCNKCNQMMKFDYYSNKFKCLQCHNTLNIEELASNDMFLNMDDNTNNFEIKKTLAINYQKEDFIKEVNKILKYKVLMPDCFLKFRKIKDKDIKLIYLPLILYDANIVTYSPNNENIFLYELNNMLFDEYTNFDKDTLDSLYPINLSDIIETSKLTSDLLVEKFKQNLVDILNSIQKEIRNILNNDIIMKTNNDNFEVIFLKEKIECILLPIYDFNIKYKKKIYHFAMNANIGKVSVKVPVDNIKLIIITILFLIIDIIFFYFGYLAKVIEKFGICISIIIFILEILLILCLYFFTKGINNSNDNKNKYSIKRNDITSKK